MVDKTTNGVSLPPKETPKAEEKETLPTPPIEDTFETTTIKSNARSITSAPLPPSVSLTLPDGSTYVGQLKDGNVPHGQGTWTFNGATYVGEWKHGKQDGQGSYTWVDGSTYVGNWENGRPEGHGVYIFTDKSVYSGNWKNGEQDGQGSRTWVDGSTYVGEWKHGKQDGQGTYTHVDGSKYDGNWVSGKQHGHESYIYADGTWISGKFENNHILVNQSNLADLKFLGLLTGMSSTGDSDYSLGIMANFLMQQTGEKEIAAGMALKQAEEIQRAATTTGAHTVEAALQKGNSQLLVYGFKGHTMGLNLTPDSRSQYEFVYCDLYNSGGGLEPYHVHVPEKGKYQTRLRVHVPFHALTPKKIQELLNYTQFPSAKEAYEAILNIPGAYKIEATGDEAVLQTSQKSGNCSLEWIFAYLKHNLKNYDQMRVNLFKACKEAAGNTDWVPPAGHPGTVTLTSGGIFKSQKKFYKIAEAKEILIQELVRKIKSRQQEGSQKAKNYLGGNYVGGWKGGKPEGKGIYTFANGDKYDGNWVSGQRHGQGTLTLLDGTQYEGMWVNGQFQVSSKTK